MSARKEKNTVKQLRKRLTYANLTSTLALFIALGAGSALAAGQLAPKSVGERQLRPGAVTAEKLRKEAVTAPKLKAAAVQNGKLASGAVSTAKLAAASVTAEKLAAGAVIGEKIAPDSVSGTQVIESSLGQVPAANTAATAAFAESANPAAFAAVDQEGGVDASLSKGQISVRRGAEAGIYCVSVAGFSPRGAQVTPRYNGSGNLTAYVTVGGTGSCPAPEVEVQTHNGGLTKAPFYILLYR
jgi:hypothetical protein